MVLTILKPNHWKSKQNVSHFVQISNGYRQHGGHFVNAIGQPNRGLPLEFQTHSSPHCIDLQQFVKSEIWLDLFALWLMAWGFELKVAI